MCLCCCLATSVSEAQPPGFLASGTGTGAAGSHSSVDAASELELLPSVEAESVNAASLRASLSSSPALPILRCASPLYRAPSCRGAGTKYHHVPVRTRRASGVVHRAVLTCCCSAVRCSGALLRSSAGPDRARDEARGLCVWCVGLRARCAFRAGGSGVALLVRAPLGVSVSGRRGRVALKSLAARLGRVTVGPGLLSSERSRDGMERAGGTGSSSSSGQRE